MHQTEGKTRRNQTSSIGYVKKSGRKEGTSTTGTYRSVLLGHEINGSDLFRIKMDFESKDPFHHPEMFGAELIDSGDKLERLYNFAKTHPEFIDDKIWDEQPSPKEVFDYICSQLRSCDLKDLPKEEVVFDIVDTASFDWLAYWTYNLPMDVNDMTYTFIHHITGLERYHRAHDLACKWISLLLWKKGIENIGSWPYERGMEWLNEEIAYAQEQLENEDKSPDDFDDGYYEALLNAQSYYSSEEFTKYQDLLSQKVNFYHFKSLLYRYRTNVPEIKEFIDFIKSYLWIFDEDSTIFHFDPYMIRVAIEEDEMFTGLGVNERFCFHWMSGDSMWADIENNLTQSAENGGMDDLLFIRMLSEKQHDQFNTKYIKGITDHKWILHIRNILEQTSTLIKEIDHE